MDGFQSRVRDVINQAAGATVAVADRGLSRLVDPHMSGTTRFMQKVGYPFPLLTPQMTDPLAEAVLSGTRNVILSGTRLQPWLTPGLILSLELVENHTLESFSTIPGGDTLLTFAEPTLGAHPAGSDVHIRGFAITPTETVQAGDGGFGAQAVLFSSPFLLILGDTLTINGTPYVLSFVEEVSSDQDGYVFAVKTQTEDGFPELASDAKVIVTAKAAYRSSLIQVPQLDRSPTLVGPVAVDWISGPMVIDYNPKPESELFIEQFNNASRLVSSRVVQKNDTLSCFSIQRDQMLFWKVVEGGMNWNGTHAELRAFDSGRAHLWTPARPYLDAAAPVTKDAVVPSVAPYAVLLSSNLNTSSLKVRHGLTRAEIPATSYSVDPDLGSVSFDSSLASQPVVITFQPQLEWTLFAMANADDIELVVTLGQEGKQTFDLGPAGSPNRLKVITSSTELDSIHITARRKNGNTGAFAVSLGDWTPRGTQPSCIRYTLSTGADRDHDWSSSGLMLKSMWPCLNLLKATLDQNIAATLDGGRQIF